MFKRKILILITTLTLAFAFVSNAQASIVDSIGDSVVNLWNYVTGTSEDTETTGGAAVLTSSDTAIYDKALSNLTESLKPLSKELVKGGVWLFWTLALIGLAVQGARAVFQGDGLISGPSILVRWLIVTGFFWMLIMNGGDLLLKGIDGFINWGSHVGGQNITSPTKMVDTALKEIWGPNDSFFAKTQITYDTDAKSLGFSLEKCFQAWGIYIGRFFLACFISAFIIILGFNMFMVMANMYCIFYLGLFLVGLAGAEFTRNMALPYLKTALAAGVKVLVMIIVVKIGFDLVIKSINDLTACIGHRTQYSQACYVCVVSAYLFYKIGSAIPEMVANVIGGLSTNTGSVDAGAAAASVVGLATKAAAIATGAGVLATGAGVAAGVGKVAGSSAAKAAASGMAHGMTTVLRGLMPSKLARALQASIDAVKGQKQRSFQESVARNLNNLDSNLSKNLDK